MFSMKRHQKLQLLQFVFPEGDKWEHWLCNWNFVFIFWFSLYHSDSDLWIGWRNRAMEVIRNRTQKFWSNGFAYEFRFKSMGAIVEFDWRPGASTRPDLNFVIPPLWEIGAVGRSTNHLNKCLQTACRYMLTIIYYYSCRRQGTNRRCLLNKQWNTDSNAVYWWYKFIFSVSMQISLKGTLLLQGIARIWKLHIQPTKA